MSALKDLSIPHAVFQRVFMNDNNEPAYDTHSDHRNEGPPQAELVPPLLDSWGQQFCAHGCVCQSIHNKVVCNHRS